MLKTSPTYAPGHSCIYSSAVAAGYLLHEHALDNDHLQDPYLYTTDRESPNYTPYLAAE